MDEIGSKNIFSNRQSIRLSGYDYSQPNGQLNEQPNGQPQGIAPTDKTVGDMVGAFESITTVEYIRGVKNNHWQPFDKKIWQRNYWEHIIRDEHEYTRITRYIIDNPQKWENDKLNGGVGNMVMEPPADYIM